MPVIVKNIYDPQDDSWFELIRPLAEGQLEHHTVLPAPGPDMFGKHYDIEHDYVEDWSSSADAFALFAAFEDGNDAPIGFLSASVGEEDGYDWKEGYIGDIYTDPAYRKLGVGRALMDAAMKWFSTFPEVCPITLEVWVGNEIVIPFYEKWGFGVRDYILVTENSGYAGAENSED